MAEIKYITFVQDNKDGTQTLDVLLLPEELLATKQAKFIEIKQIRESINNRYVHRNTPKDFKDKMDELKNRVNPLMPDYKAIGKGCTEEKVKDAVGYTLEHIGTVYED